MKCDRSGPEPDQLGAVFLDDFFWSGAVAERFRQRAAVAVERPAVGRAGAERRRVAQAHADQKRALEPAAILVAAFHIKVGGPAKAVFRAERREMARSGIEPHVENVVLFREFGRAALPADGPGRNEFGGGAFEPDIRRMGLEQIDDAVEDRLVGERFAAGRTVETRRSARPRRAGGRCTSRDGWRSCSRCALRPIPGSISRL